MNDEKFDAQIISSGAFIDNVVGDISESFLVKTTVIRLNPAALNTWNLANLSSDSKCAKVKHKIAELLGMADPIGYEVYVKQVLSEIFTVVCIKKIGERERDEDK